MLPSRGVVHYDKGWSDRARPPAARPAPRGPNHDGSTLRYPVRACARHLRPTLTVPRPRVSSSSRSTSAPCWSRSASPATARRSSAAACGSTRARRCSRAATPAPAIVLGQPDKSLLLKAVRRQGELKMPPKEDARLDQRPDRRAGRLGQDGRPVAGRQSEAGRLVRRGGAARRTGRSAPSPRPAVPDGQGRRLAANARRSIHPREAGGEVSWLPHRRPTGALSSAE